MKAEESEQTGITEQQGRSGLACVLKTALGSVSQMLALCLNMFCVMVWVVVCAEDHS